MEFDQQIQVEVAALPTQAPDDVVFAFAPVLGDKTGVASIKGVEVEFLGQIFENQANKVANERWLSREAFVRVVVVGHGSILSAWGLGGMGRSGGDGLGYTPRSFRVEAKEGSAGGKARQFLTEALRHGGRCALGEC